MLRMDKTARSKAVEVAAMALLILAALTVGGERNEVEHPRHRSACLNDLGPMFTSGVPYRAMRFIDDPGAGRHWVMLQQLDRPEIPPLVVLIPRDHPCVSPDFEVFVQGSSPVFQNRSTKVIHLGDHILLSQSTAKLNAQLDAVALHSAAVGEAFSVRLQVGGHLVQAVATSPGRATLLVDENRGW
jgi:hypothetical protein